MWVHLNNVCQRRNRPREIKAQATAKPGDTRHTVEHGWVYGLPKTVCNKLAPVYGAGVGGLILHFRLGSLPWEATSESMQLFAAKVAPEFAASVCVNRSRCYPAWRGVGIAQPVQCATASSLSPC
jgi:hypothetical protein